MPTFCHYREPLSLLLLLMFKALSIFCCIKYFYSTDLSSRVVGVDSSQTQVANFHDLRLDLEFREMTRDLTFQFVTPSVCLLPSASISLSASLCLSPSVCLPPSASICLPPSVCLPLSASLCLPPSVCLPLSASLCLPPSVCLPPSASLCLPPSVSLVTWNMRKTSYYDRLQWIQ